MRRVLTFFLLASAAAAPLAAQVSPPDQRPSRDDRGDRPDRGTPGEAQWRGERAGGDPRIVRRDAAQRDQRGPGGDPRGEERRDERGPGWRGPNGRGPDRQWEGRGPDGRGPGRDWDGRGREGGRPDWRGPDGRGPDRRGPGGRDWREGDRGGWQGGPRGGWNDRDGRGNGGWNSGWRNDRRYDWQGYRAGNRALYRAPRYYGPRGHDYSRWSRGYRVQPYFYGRNYWINDPYRYRLPPVYGDYRWVRYYDDVALIDIRTGLIEDIIYSFFYR